MQIASRNRYRTKIEFMQQAVDLKIGGLLHNTPCTYFYYSYHSTIILLYCL